MTRTLLPALALIGAAAGPALALDHATTTLTADRLPAAAGKRLPAAIPEWTPAPAFRAGHDGTRPVPLDPYEVSLRLDPNLSLDIAGSAPSSYEAHALDARPIDGAQLYPSLILTLHPAPGAPFDPYIGAGIEPDPDKRFTAGPFDRGQNEVIDFAYSVVAGFNVDMGERWKVKLKADLSRIGIGAKYTLN